MALSDLRDLKAKNAALQQQFDKANAAVANPAAPSRASGGCLDWEAEKRRILAALEADFDEHNAQRVRRAAENRGRASHHRTGHRRKRPPDPTVEAAVGRATRKAAARAPDPAAVDQALDGDAGIQEERQRLKRLQEEWQEKCRQAEIEISLERAKLARQRADVEQIHAAANDALAPPPAAGTAGHGERPASGRWLAKLGLSDADRERKRN